MTIMLSTLRELAQSHSQVRIDRDSIDGETLIGQVVSCTPHLLALARRDEGGRPDGLVVARTRMVTRIQWDTPVLRASGSIEPELLRLYTKVDLRDFRRVVLSLSKMFNVICFYDERARVVTTGAVLRAGNAHARLCTFSPPESTYRAQAIVSFAAVTMIGAGEAYSRYIETLHVQPSGDPHRG